MLWIIGYYWLFGWKKCCDQDRCQWGRAGQLPWLFKAAVMSTCHALPEAKIQLLNKKAYSALYYYKEQKIISHLRGIVNSNSTVSCSDGFSLPSNEEADQEESPDGLRYLNSGRLERSRGLTAEALIHFLARSCLEAQYTSHHNGPRFFQDYTMNIFCQVALQKVTVYKL